MRGHEVESIYLWPGNPILSLFVLWVASTIFLWAARKPMLRLLDQLGSDLGEGIDSAGKHVTQAAGELKTRHDKTLLAAGMCQAQGRLDRELQRMDEGFSEQMRKYGDLQRRLDEAVLAVDRDYQDCGAAPPEVPGWSAAVKTLANLPLNGDPNIQKVLEGIKASSQEAEKKALSAYRSDSAKRHKILGGMLPHWKDIRSLLARMSDSVSQALESASRINEFVEDYEKIRDETEESARALTYSAIKFFFVSLLVLGVACGGAFINFQLIALPMSELVPAGARVGGIPVSTVSALVLVLMEAALGIFLMDMLGITELFPKLSTIPRSRRRMILWLCISGLFFLSAVEGSLAILREQIVEADAALKLSLAGEESRIIDSASNSIIPVVGQAVLGFILPWVLALVAVPLEMLLDSGRHIAGALTVVFLRVLGATLSGIAVLIRHVTNIMTNFYDVYVSIPLRIEGWVTGVEEDDLPGGFGSKMRGMNKRDEGRTRGGSLA
ncbi:MAG: hypothetical protein JRG89_17660 [Deltaproteobacteria bacterium]|nr:hypothetical protein [Deltaproteobacteria bacterium]MBW2390233.1 hypothetical protein [Deltaproteobacteria bacterium]MBW2723842.1 hypothetical protein [Deltaproteobacteria bacterium]